MSWLDSPQMAMLERYLDVVSIHRGITRATWIFAANWRG
jgi:hypothetical protein